MQRAVFSGQTNRLFVGLVPDDEALDALARSVSTMRQEIWARDVRWLPRENIHLTFRFLGDADKEKYICLSAALVHHVGKIHEFTINLSQVLFLPSASKASVVAVGVNPCSELENLAAVVEKSVVSCGFEPEKRRFKAHITVGRCRDMDLRGVNIGSNFHGINVPVCTVELMKSNLSDSGAVYGILDTVTLLPY
ncbi:MAG: RNA 2',3'-cyclic phosphodiesterase [Desulfobacteraceae bacterium]